MNKTNMTPPPDSLRDYLIYDDGKIYRADTKARVGHLGNNGYHIFTYKKRTYLVHRLIYWLHTGEWPEYVDHINGDQLDNRKENLRAATKSDNAVNIRVKANNTTGYTGVVKRLGKYNAQIMLNGKRCTICGYETAEAAALARDLMSHWFFGEFSRFGVLDKQIKVGGKAI
ncbi:HNH endonuclease [Salmonella enterica subsp. enterica serovar Braenderup]|nr:HNH endonuclease [Salmonella enterica subsp. enterica serovar Braenderup]